MTYKQMCEKVVAFLGNGVTAEQVWNVSPSGELWPIHALYDLCVSRGMPA